VVAVVVAVVRLVVVLCNNLIDFGEKIKEDIFTIINFKIILFTITILILMNLIKKSYF